MKERAESGLTVKAYCETAGFHQNSYFYWQRKLREASCGEMAVAGALPAPDGWAVATSGPKAMPAPTLTVEIGKCRVHIVKDVDERLLAKVCSALMPLC
jgi:hypothetical protein